MLRFGKTTEYALLALIHLAQSPSGKASAREIAEAFRLPGALVGKLLKCLHQNGLLGSERGVHGGYRIAVDLSTVSIEQLLRMFHRTELGDRPNRTTADGLLERSDFLPTEPPLLALHRKMEGFLRGISLSDVVIPGRRIDVPVEFIGMPKKLKEVVLAQ